LLPKNSNNSYRKGKHFAQCLVDIRTGLLSDRYQTWAFILRLRSNTVMKTTSTLPKAFIYCSLLALIACGDSSSNNSNDGMPGTPADPQTKQGVFLDSAVEGLSYSSGALTGFTDAAGTFEYEDGQSVTFSVGGVVIGTAIGADTITPLELISAASDSSNSTVINIARFLQTLDDDANPDNGITILESVRDLAADQTVNFEQAVTTFADDGNVQTVISTLTTVTNAGARLLITAAAAQAHLNATLETLNGGDNPPTDNTQLSITGEEASTIGTSLAVNDIAYGLADFTGVERSVVMAGRGLDIDSLVASTTTAASGFYLVALDAGVEFAGALVVVVDGEDFEYECTINCGLSINYAARNVLFNDASFINTVSGNEILLNGSVAWTVDDEIVDSSDDGDSGPSGNGDVCPANLATDISLQGNNAYSFTVNDGECLGLVESDVEKVVLPLSITGDLQGLVFDDTIKVAKTIVNITAGGSNIANIFWYYTFNVTNTSDFLVCTRFENAQTLDINSTLINQFNASIDGNYFNNTSRDCIAPGQTLPVYGNNTKTLLTSDADFERDAIENINRVVIDADFSVRTFTPQASWQANYFEWKNNGIEASFTNTLGGSVELQDDDLTVRYFDSEGFLVSRANINIYDALGIEKEQLQSSDFIIGAGETLILADDVADIAHLTLRPASAVKAVIFLEWAFQ
jgi:hypothetical protein